MANAPAPKPPAPSAAMRSLANLEAYPSSARVLNLAATSRDHGRTPDHRERPLMRSWPLNNALILKQRGPEAGALATRIHPANGPGEPGVSPMGVLVGAEGWREDLAAACGGVDEALEADLATLQALDELATFEPFMAREHLRRRGLDIAPCYFAAPAAELEAARNAIVSDVAQLVLQAFGGQGAMSPEQTAKLVGAILSAQDDPRLEPLRRTFGLAKEAFQDAVFAWKAFLYFKWAMTERRVQTGVALQEFSRLLILPPTSQPLEAHVDTARERLRKGLLQELTAAAQVLAVYDKAFGDMTAKGDPRMFRDFLTAAPDLLAPLCDRMGALAQFAVHWRRLYPIGIKVEASGPDAVQLIRDLEVGLGDWTPPQDSQAAA